MSQSQIVNGEMRDAAEFVRQMRDLGAERVRVGSVEVHFAVELVPVVDAPRLTEEELEAEDDRIRFAHVEGL